jgi:hypothetical protein
MGYMASEGRITRKDIKGGAVAYFKLLRMNSRKLSRTPAQVARSSRKIRTYRAHALNVPATAAWEKLPYTTPFGRCGYHPYILVRNIKRAASSKGAEKAGLAATLGRLWVRFLARTPVILYAIFCGFPQSFQANAAAVPRFLPNPFQFIQHSTI